MGAYAATTYALKTTGCGSSLASFCEARRPRCPKNYAYHPDMGNVCLKLSTTSTITLDSGQKYMSIHTAHKICLSEKTRVFTAYNLEELKSAQEWLLPQVDSESIRFFYGWRTVTGGFMGTSDQTIVPSTNGHKSSATGPCYLINQACVSIKNCSSFQCPLIKFKNHILKHTSTEIKFHLKDKLGQFYSATQKKIPPGKYPQFHIH